MKIAKGSVKAAAMGLGMSRTALRERIDRNPQLFALYGHQGEDAEIAEETETGTMLRTPADLPATQPENRELAETLMKQDRELLRSGLQAAGIKPETIARIRSLDGLARNTGAFLSVSMDFTHRLHIFSQAALFEEMEYIRKNHLRADKMDPMVKVMWQRAFNEIADMLGKGYDRTLAGTQAMMAIMSKSGGEKPGAGATKGKPGWQQARDVTVAPQPTSPPPS